MLQLTESEIIFIKDNLKNGDELIKNDDIGALLESIHDLIMEKGHDKNQDITNVGRNMEKFYDSIYENNC